MSQENVDAVRQGYDAFNRGDIEGVLEMLDPQICWDQLVCLNRFPQLLDRLTRLCWKRADHAAAQRHSRC
jgi:hypothetical protein